ncbi:MFS transporter [Chloroflexota bacterium]
MAKEETSPLTRVGKPRIFYGNIIVVSGFSIMLIIHGIFNTFGIFFTPLLAEFGTTRAVLSGANSFAFFVTGFLAIIMGILADKFGPRVVLTTCTVFFGIGYLLMSQASAIWQVYLIFIVIGVGLSASDVVPLSIVVRWFVKKRGAMSGIMKVGTGAGMMAMPLVASGLIGAFDWRTSYIILAALVLVILIPMALLVRRDPREMGLLPDGEIQEVTESPALVEQGLSFREAIHTRQLWIVCGFYMTTVFCGMTLMVHIVPHAVDMGVSAVIAAGTASTIGGTSMLGRFVMGFVGDRIGHKRAIVICFLMAVITLSWLQVARELWMLYLFAAVYGFNHGGYYALISPLIAGLFGTRSQGTILGIVICSGTIGGGIGMVLAGHIYDITNSYRLAFLILLVLAIIGLILATLIKPIGKGRTNDSTGRN